MITDIGLHMICTRKNCKFADMLKEIATKNVRKPPDHFYKKQRKR